MTLLKERGTELDVYEYTQVYVYSYTYVHIKIKENTIFLNSETNEVECLLIRD